MSKTPVFGNKALSILVLYCENEKCDRSQKKTPCPVRQPFKRKVIELFEKSFCINISIKTEKISV